MAGGGGDECVDDEPTGGDAGLTIGADAGADDGAGRVTGAVAAAGLDGERCSIAPASRCRSTATWLSQHSTLQNTNRSAARLHVDTLHA